MDKEQILTEIRRTAEENAGVPLGQRRFSLVTGIGKHDWFAPNDIQQRHDERFMLESYAALVLELGRIPSNSDVRLKRARTPTFPNDKTFARFGGKSNLVARVAEFCADRPEYVAVQEMCLTYTPPVTQIIARVRPRKDTATSDGPAQYEADGFVYMIRSGSYHKIGKSNAAGRRERELEFQLPEKTKTVHVIKTDDPSGIEAYWHSRFADKRRHGEWFELTAGDVKAFKRRRFM